MGTQIMFYRSFVTSKGAAFYFSGFYAKVLLLKKCRIFALLFIFTADWPFEYFLYTQKKK